jgi:type I restriction enzyme S subunit
MWSHDAVIGTVSADEVLVSRSNTEALVGRAARFPGGPQSVVATDLVFRLVPAVEALNSAYLAGYLSVLQLQGYWHDRSAGASSTMKKITKSLLFDVELPLPPLVEQLRTIEGLQERMGPIRELAANVSMEREAIKALGTALLRRAFEDVAA